MTIVDLNNLSAFIGGNSTGKTALIHALVKLFGINSHDRTLVKTDFHIPISVAPETIRELHTFIEVRIDFPELLHASDDVHSQTSIPPFFNQMVIRDTGETPYIRVRLVGKWTVGSTPEGEIDQKTYFVTVAEGIEETEDDMVPITPHQRSTIQVIYVPAVREPSQQLRNASGTLLWRLLNIVTWPEGIDDDIRTRMEPINKLFNEIDGVNHIKDVIAEEWRKYHKDPRYQKAKMQFSSSDLSSILKKVEIMFSPTETLSEYSVEKLGDGLRSLFYLSLVSSLLEAELRITGTSNATLTILAVEEPENHISPHLLGRVMDNLKNLSKKPNAQVVLTSHSSSIIKRVDPEHLNHLRIDSSRYSTIVNKIVLPVSTSEAYTYIKEAVKAYPEIYFSRLVILGEGDTEEIVIPKILEANGINADDFGISIVPLGGRHVNHMWKLLNELNIPHITLLDLDRERGGGGWSRIKYVIKQLLLNGSSREGLLKVSYKQNDGTTRDEIIQDDELERFDNYSLEPNWIESMDKVFLTRLMNPEHNVFFSSPLDLDFLMLESFPQPYKETVPRGPNIPDPVEHPTEYNNKIKKGIEATLKNESATGFTYSTDQHELMVWYKTLFLGRSKPGTHIEAISKISNDQLVNQLPLVFKQLVSRVNEILGRDV